MQTSAFTYASVPSGVVPLLGALASPESNWGAIRVSGADATAFLHAQLSNDVKQLSDTQARLAAWCSAQGRMLASFVLVRELVREQNSTPESSYLLLCRADLLAATIKRLKMFVLRSKVQIEDASDDVAVYGLLGEAAQTHWQGQAGAQTEPLAEPLANAPWSALRQQVVADAVADADTATPASRLLVWLYPANLPPHPALPRALCVQARHLPPPAGAIGTLADWQYAEVCGGVATIEQANSDAFVPQMLNFESVGGVSFKKGCYPGQEVVARSQFRGAIKRRAYVANGFAASNAEMPATTMPAVAMPVWSVPLDSAPTEQTPEECGQIVQVAIHPSGHVAAIVCLQNSAAQAIAQGAATLRLGSATGLALQLQPLAYALVEI